MKNTKYLFIALVAAIALLITLPAVAGPGVGSTVIAPTNSQTATVSTAASALTLTNLIEPFWPGTNVGIAGLGSLTSSADVEYNAFADVTLIGCFISNTNTANTVTTTFARGNATGEIETGNYWSWTVSLPANGILTGPVTNYVVLTTNMPLSWIGAQRTVWINTVTLTNAVAVQITTNNQVSTTLPLSSSAFRYEFDMKNMQFPQQ